MKLLLTAAAWLLFGAPAHAGDPEEDPLAIFGQMIDDETIAGLDEKSTADLARVVSKPGLTNHTEAEHGQETNPLMTLDGNCLEEAIRIRTAQVGIEQAKKDIKKWKDLLANNEMSEMEYWRHVAECKDYCAQVMTDAIVCYQQTTASRFRGIFLFDTGIGAYQKTTRGDRASAGKTHDNERVMQQVVATLKANAGDHVLLEGRASRVGNDQVNFRLSGTRADSIRDELLRRGVPRDRIHFRWIGEGEPYYREGLARLYQIADKYRAFGSQTLNQSVTVYIYNPSGS